MAIDEVEILDNNIIEAKIIKPKKTYNKVTTDGKLTEADPVQKTRGTQKGSKHTAPKKWVEIVQYYLSGHSVAETLKKYRVGERAFFYQLGKRDIHKVVRDEAELTPQDLAELDKEPKLKDKIRAELQGAKDRFDIAVKANNSDIGIANTIENEAMRLKIYDEVLPILKEKNPILARNLSAISAKILTRANALLDSELSPRDLNDVASALAKINDVLQIIPKTQPLIAQQFNIGGKQQDKEIAIKDVDIKVEFI